jgi:NAD(P)-dependent dehydrogenase (short-subunit alcohol dehydrogenase family)
MADTASRPIVSLITGANKGIGFAAAQTLGRLGHIVLLGSRDIERGRLAVEQLTDSGIDAQLVPLETTHDESVRAAATWIDETFGRLDVLINNAGAKLEDSPALPSDCTVEIVRETYETNVFGTIRVTLAMLPLLRRSDAPRIVNVSSGLGSLTLATTPGTPYFGHALLSYNTSKAALNSVTVQFANELRATPFKVNIADPGYTATDMTSRGRPARRTAADGAAIIVRLATLPANGPTCGYFDQDGTVPW